MHVIVILLTHNKQSTVSTSMPKNTNSLILAPDIEMERESFVFLPHPSWGLKQLNEYEMSTQIQYSFVVDPKRPQVPEFLVLSNLELAKYKSLAPNYGIQIKLEDAAPMSQTIVEIAAKRRLQMQSVKEQEEENTVDQLTAEEPIIISSSSSSSSSSSTKKPKTK